MMLDWLKLNLLALEAAEVIWLRSAKLVQGGPRAKAEARMMVAEKAVAAENAIFRLFAGDSLDNIVASYRKQVRSNSRRLLKG